MTGLPLATPAPHDRPGHTRRPQAQPRTSADGHSTSQESKKTARRARLRSDPRSCGRSAAPSSRRGRGGAGGRRARPAAHPGPRRAAGAPPPPPPLPPPSGPPGRDQALSAPGKPLPYHRRAGAPLPRRASSSRRRGRTGPPGPVSGAADAGAVRCSAGRGGEGRGGEGGTHTALAARGAAALPAEARRQRRERCPRPAAPRPRRESAPAAAPPRERRGCPAPHHHHPAPAGSPPAAPSREKLGRSRRDEPGARPGRGGGGGEAAPLPCPGGGWLCPPPPPPPRQPHPSAGSRSALRPPSSKFLSERFGGGQIPFDPGKGFSPSRLCKPTWGICAFVCLFVCENSRREAEPHRKRVFRLQCQPGSFDIIRALAAENLTL